MRVAHRVLVAERAVDARRDLERRDVDRAVDVAGRVAQDLRVARRLEQAGQEGVLGLEAEQHDDVGAVEQDGEARLHRHGVDVLDAGGEARHLDEVAADVAGHVGEVGNGRDDLDLVAARRRARRRATAQRDERARVAMRFMAALLSGRGSRARGCRGSTVHCRKNWFSWLPGASRYVYCSRRRWNSEAQMVRYGE